MAVTLRAVANVLMWFFWVSCLVVAAHARRSSAGPGPCPEAAAPAQLPTPAPKPLADALAAFDKRMEAMMPAAQGLGAYAAVVVDQQLVFEKGYGVTARTGGHVPDRSTVFRVGSVSKVFTDLMLLLLQQDGKVAASDPVTDYVPAYKPRDIWESTSRGATLKDLGSHMAGLPRYSPCPFFSCNETLDTIVERISNWTLLQSPGVRPSYSNAGFSLLGAILAGVAGVKFDEYITSNVFEPLGMGNSSYHKPSDLSNVALGYFSGGVASLESLHYENPAGGLLTSGEDMVKFMQLLNRVDVAAHATPQQILDGKSIREWLTEPVFHNPTVVQPDTLVDDAWYMPWEVSLANIPSNAPFDRFRVVSKDGEINGYNAMLSLQPDLKLGVFVAMSGNATGAGTGFDDAVVFGTAFDLVPGVQSALASLAQLPAAPPSPELYVGLYYAPSTSIMINVTWDSASHLLNFTASVSSPDPLLDVPVPGFGANVGNSQAVQLVWLAGNVFQPVVAGACWLLEGGTNYNWEFILDNDGNAGRLLAQGHLPYDLYWARVK